MSTRTIRRRRRWDSRPPLFAAGLVGHLRHGPPSPFAFDYGSRDHGGVAGWWCPQYYDVVLGAPLGPCTDQGGMYRRDFEHGTVIASPTSTTTVTFPAPHRDIATGQVGTTFTVPQGDARIFVSLRAVYLPLVARNQTGEQSRGK